MLPYVVFVGFTCIWMVSGFFDDPVADLQTRASTATTVDATDGGVAKVSYHKALTQMEEQQGTYVYHFIHFGGGDDNNKCINSTRNVRVFYQLGWM